MVLGRDSRASKDDDKTTNTSCSTDDPSTSDAQKKSQNPNFSLPIISLISVSSKQRSPFTFSSLATVSSCGLGFQINGEIATTIDCFVCSGYQTLAPRIRHLCDFYNWNKIMDRYCDGHSFRMFIFCLTEANGSGILGVGLPRTGKTLLVKAVAGKAEVPFIICSVSEFVELYVSMGASCVRVLFFKGKEGSTVNHIYRRVNFFSLKYINVAMVTILKNMKNILIGVSELQCFLCMSAINVPGSNETPVKVERPEAVKVHVGCSMEVVWRHTPWLGAHTAKGPVRPLRRALQVRTAFLLKILKLIIL
ncbi:hypothetical protein L1987_13841 [Smallanthus sonchifolius]|uniref:Uncharacterized protein n=1 Tax=Smallanthus sonchifolius TaxID=185202 RepID=A0ACB9JJU4_9ASTR|nr:hypothetical protein L1987_13841 [Smallanthus sonchifolius]